MTTQSPAARSPFSQFAWMGIALALLGASAFATKGIVVKLALLDDVDTLTTLTWRMLVAVPIFVTVGIVSYRRHLTQQAPGVARVLDGKTLLQTLGVGVLGYYLASYLDFTALEYISAQFDRLILLTYPFFVVLFGAIFFKRKVTRMMIAGQLLSYAGIAVIFFRDLHFEGKDVILGFSLVLGSAVAYAAYQIIAKPLIDKLGARLFTSIAMSGAGPAVVLHFLVTHPVSALAVPAESLPLMLAIGTLSTVLPAYCISAAIGLIGPERTAVIGNISPVVTISLAVGILGEAFTWWHAAGTALVLCGAWLFTRKARPKVAEVDVEP